LLIRKDFDEFCRRYPAFFFGVCLFAGAWISLCPWDGRGSRLLLCLSVVPFLRLQRFCIAVLLVVTAIFSTASRVSTFSAPFSAQGTLIAEVTDRHLVTIHGKSSWRIDLFLHEFRNTKGSLLAKGVYIHTHAPLPCPVRGGGVYKMRGALLVD